MPTPSFTQIGWDFMLPMLGLPLLGFLCALAVTGFAIKRRQPDEDRARLIEDHRLRLAHLIVGVVFIVGFLLTGQYMHHFLGHLQEIPDTQRMLYRSTHIYLLWSALLNFALGLYLRLSDTKLCRAAQCCGSVMILGGPLLLSFAFFIEPSLAGLLRPLSRAAIYSTFGGLLLHGLAATSRWRSANRN